jgi:hypothetical protein
LKTSLICPRFHAYDFLIKFALIRIDHVWNRRIRGQHLLTFYQQLLLGCDRKSVQTGLYL